MAVMNNQTDSYERVYPIASRLEAIGERVYLQRLWMTFVFIPPHTLHLTFGFGLGFAWKVHI